MHRSFGIEATPISTRWEDLMRGPSRAEVGAHLYKIVNYQELTRAEAEQSAFVLHPALRKADEPAREAESPALPLRHAA